MLLHYKKLLKGKRLTAKEVQYHATDIQESLEKFEENFAELIRIARMMIQFFPDRKDRRDYDNKINGACTLFNQIYQDIQDVAFEEQSLVKKI
jgi:hypothetical protein